MENIQIQNELIIELDKLNIQYTALNEQIRLPHPKEFQEGPTRRNIATLTRNMHSILTKMREKVGILSSIDNPIPILCSKGLDGRIPTSDNVKEYGMIQMIKELTNENARLKIDLRIFRKNHLSWTDKVKGKMTSLFKPKKKKLTFFNKSQIINSNKKNEKISVSTQTVGTVQQDSLTSNTNSPVIKENRLKRGETQNLDPSTTIDKIKLAGLSPEGKENEKIVVETTPQENKDIKKLIHYASIEITEIPHFVARGSKYYTSIAFRSKDSFLATKYRYGMTLIHRGAVLYSKTDPGLLGQSKKKSLLKLFVIVFGVLIF